VAVGLGVSQQGPLHDVGQAPFESAKGRRPPQGRCVHAARGSL